MNRNRDDVAQTLGLGKPNRTRRYGLFGAAGLVAVALLAFIGNKALRGTGGPEYETARAAMVDFDVIVTATGTIEPTNLVEISSELSGTVASVHVDYNDIVEVGSVLASLDTEKLEAELAVSKASLDAAIARVAMAEASLVEAQEMYQTSQRLEERGVTAHQVFVVNEARYNRARAELQSAQAERALAAANLDLRRTELDKACICSPVAGMILDRSVDPGQIVASSLSAPILFTVAEDLTQMELHLDIDEADIGHVAVGQRAEFTVDAYDDRRFPADIVLVRFAPETVDGVVTYKAILSIDNADLSLRPGMTATADIVVAEIRDMLVVPNAALRFAPPQESAEPEDADRSGLLGMLIPDNPDDGLSRANDRTVWVLDGGIPREVSVTPGPSDGKVTQLKGGDIKEGDHVIAEQIND